MAERTADDWDRDLGQKGIGVVRVYEGSISDFTNTDPVLRQTGMVADVEHPIYGPVLRHGLPVKFSMTPGRLAAGCLIGQHTDAVLAELGYVEDQINELKEQGVILHHPILAIVH